MKKILVISPFKIFPTYAGFDTRVYNIIEQLANRYKIIFFYVDFNKKIRNGDNFLLDVEKYRFGTRKRWIQLFHPSLIIKGIKVIKSEKIDVIIAESIWAGLHALILHEVTRVPYYFTEHNFEYVRWKRMGRKCSRILKIYEKLCCKLANKVFCVSENDKKLICKLGIDCNKIVIVPNGVDTEKFKPDVKTRETVRKKHGFSSETPIILFYGALTYIPNFQAVQIIRNILLDKILSRVPDAKFLIVGSNPPLQYKHEAISFTGTVERIEDYVNASDVVIAPLISGGGTKLKILEAIACGKTVVTTSIGAEGLIDENTKTFLRVADDCDKFIDEIVYAVKKTESNNVPKAFIDKYSWKSIGKKICEEI